MKKAHVVSRFTNAEVPSEQSVACWLHNKYCQSTSIIEQDNDDDDDDDDDDSYECACGHAMTMVQLHSS